MEARNDLICIIPARGGSKRVPRKNVRILAGLPLIAHSIRAALASRCFARVVVSTDDEEIADIACQYGAETPFRRDPDLAGDHAGTAEVIVDAIERLGAQEVAHVCCLYPTAPLIRPGDLVDTLHRIRQAGAYSLIPVTGFDFPPLRAFSMSADGRVAFNWPQYALTRSQDLPELVHDAGAFYWLETGRFLKTRRLVGEDSIGWLMERLRAVDIDTEEDLRFAEALMQFHAEARTDAQG